LVFLRVEQAAKIHLLSANKSLNILRLIILGRSLVNAFPIQFLLSSFYPDKGYVDKELAELLFIEGLHLITSIRNNMKNVLMELKDRILLRKRAVIETVNDELKNMCKIEHSRHRAFTNFIANTVAALIEYSFFPKKPSIKF